jgi:hypothetical protein
MPSQAHSEALTLVHLENRQLQETIKVLRETLERLQIDAEERVQHAVAAANHDLVQLKAIIAAQREAMEHLKIRHEEHLQALEGRHRDEMQQLQHTIVALRELLEAQHGKS